MLNIEWGQIDPKDKRRFKPVGLPNPECIILRIVHDAFNIVDLYYKKLHSVSLYGLQFIAQLMQ